MNQKLLDRFFNDECSPQEQRRILAWYLSGEADQELSEKIHAYWIEVEKNKDVNWEKDALFKSIDKQINLSERYTKPLYVKGNPGIFKHWEIWNHAAVIVLLMISMGGLYFQFIYEDIHLTSVQQVKKTDDQEKLLFKQTARGEKLTVILSDSTVVKLNSESQLKYSSLSPREVFLEGEAFFDVARDTLHPFLIHTGTITTRVLGTSFNIKAFAEEEGIAVSVVSGEVNVEQKNKTDNQIIHLIPGEQMLYLREDTLFTKRLFDYQNVLSWKDERLYFKNADFSEVVRSLERWYGVEIVVQRKGIENGFSGSYTNRSLESVLEGMSFVLGFEYEIQDKKIIIQ